MFKRIASLSLTAIMLLGSAVSVQAADISSSGGNGSSKVTLDVSSRTFRVTVPSVLPIWVDSDNNVTVADNAKIRNLSEGPVDVTNVSVEADNGWSLVPFNTDFKKVPVDTKQYGMTMYGDDVIDGVDLSLFDRIDGSDEISVVYDGNVAIQQRDINKADIGHVVFTVAWAEGTKLGPNDITYNVENADVQAFLATPAYDSSDYSYTNMTSATIARADKPASGNLTVPDGANTITVTSSTDGKSFTDTLSGTSYVVQNLIPGVSYTYEMKDSSNTVVKTGTITPTGQVRMINVQPTNSSLGNVRDIGGWQTAYGTIKYGKFYRGSRLEETSEETKTLFTDFLGIKSEIDLRGNDEVSTDSSVLTGVSYFHQPLGAYSVKPYNTPQTEAVKSVFTQIASDLRNSKPIYIHCAAGADRTATICCVLEGMLGVSQSDVDRDYELSSYYAPDRVRNGYNGAWTQMINDINTYCRGNSFEEKCIYYLQWVGVSDADINTIRQTLINGNVATVSRTETEMFNKSNATLNSRLNSSGSVVSYSVSEGNVLVTDWIPVSKYDIIEFHSDITQSDNYAAYSQIYDGNKALLYIATKNAANGGIWKWNNSMTDGTFKLWDVKHAIDSSNWDIQYMRFIVQYNDIDSISIIKR